MVLFMTMSLSTCTDEENQNISDDTLVEKAGEENSSNARPELSVHLDNMDDYDTIFIVYPNWWFDVPM